MPIRQTLPVVTANGRRLAKPLTSTCEANNVTTPRSHGPSPESLTQQADLDALCSGSNVAIMRLRIIIPTALIIFAGAPLMLAQTPAPNESPAASPSPAKHRHKTKASATPAESAAPNAAASPEASASPAKRRGRKKAESSTASAAASPAGAAAAATTATPKPSGLGRLFSKPSPTVAPVAAATPMAKGQTASAAGATPMPGGGHGQVWVNTESKVFHREGSRYYGKTKKGKYMTEEEALKEGYRPPKKGE